MTMIYHKTKDVTNRRYGKLLAIEYTGKVDGQYNTIWLWRCDCGNEFERSRRNVLGAAKLGRVPSCPNCRVWPSLESGESSKHRVIDSYTRSANIRKLEFRLDNVQLDRLFGSDCHYCGSAPSNVENHGDANGEFIYQGIDRIDNGLDYVPFNVVPCCKVCNYAKRNMGYLEFVTWIKLTANHLEARYE